MKQINEWWDALSTETKIEMVKKHLLPSRTINYLTQKDITRMFEYEHPTE